MVSSPISKTLGHEEITIATRLAGKYVSAGNTFEISLKYILHSPRNGNVLGWVGFHLNIPTFNSPNVAWDCTEDIVIKRGFCTHARYQTCHTPIYTIFIVWDSFN